MTTYTPFKTCLLRIPLYSLDKFFEILQYFNSDTESLKQVINTPEILEALYIASPEFHSEILKWLNNVDLSKKDTDKIITSLYKYLARITNRCTPFGLFAGISTGVIGENTQIEHSGNYNCKRHIRLDMNYLCALAQDLSKLPKIKEKMKYFKNTSLYFNGFQYRMVEYRYVNAKRYHFSVSFENTDYFKMIIEASQGGASILDLASLLVSDEITIDEASSYINELIDSQVLISELEPTVTGDDFLSRIIQILSKFPELEQYTNILKNVNQKLNEINKLPIGINIQHYKELADLLKSFDTKYELKYLFQADMLNAIQDFTITEKVTNDIFAGIEFLNKITKPSKTNLTVFRDAFSERYETREIPLLQALDIESGIGYLQGAQDSDITPLLDNLFLGGKAANEMDVKWNELQNIIYYKYIDAISKKQTEIQLLDADFKNFKVNWNDLPATMSAMVEIDGNPEDLNYKIFISSVGSSSAGTLIGRFARIDEKILNHLNEITAKEQEVFDGKIVAEIVHLPESRTGNVLFRPSVRKYEIPYLANSPVSDIYQLKLDDLYISVNNNRVVLRSKKHNKEIIPRLTNAHNYSSNALPVYQFLCDLQTQEIRSGLFFNAGFLSNIFGFLPRISYKNIILSKATWNIETQKLKNVIDEKDEVKQISLWNIWKNENNLPKFVFLVDYDNKLVIDTENKSAINTLLSLIKQRPSFKLEEYLHTTENNLIKGADGSFANQFIFSFYKNQKQSEVAKK